MKQKDWPVGLYDRERQMIRHQKYLNMDDVSLTFISPAEEENTSRSLHPMAATRWAMGA